ncbi:MAG: DUF1194 domain-containing protein [Rhodobacteraceae bacterium]|nr:DUF1194 domain-containing protein [Paracoccaceae bacterium]
MKGYFALFGFFLTLLPGLAAAQACGVALALAVDVSGSVDDGEYALQMGGLADALRDGSVADALAEENAYVMLVQWTGNSRQSIAVPWQQVKTPEDAAALADKVEAAERTWRHFSTAIGEALVFSANQFAQVPGCKRKVIDVSGDGYSNEGLPPEHMSEALAAQGFVVNGLAIEGDDEDLTGYYAKHVITGPNAFVMTANSFEDYPHRIRRKLLREVTKQIVAR